MAPSLMTNQEVEHLIWRHKIDAQLEEFMNLTWEEKMKRASNRWDEKRNAILKILGIKKTIQELMAEENANSNAPSTFINSQEEHDFPKSIIICGPSKVEGNEGRVIDKNTLIEERVSVEKVSKVVENSNKTEKTATVRDRAQEDALAESASSDYSLSYSLSNTGSKSLEFTEDEGGSDDDNEESSDSFESEDFTGTSDSEEPSNNSSDIDNEVAADYFEGIGGSDRMLNLDELVGRNGCASPGNGHTTDGFDDTLEKLGGIALQEASKEYGMMKPRSGRKCHAKDCKTSGAKYSWLSSLDDEIFVKDQRTISGKKKHVGRLPRSWPSETSKERKFGKTSGEKKKH